MSDIDHPQSLPQTILLKAVRRLLRPLIVLMIRNGITFPVLADQIRTLYVDVAIGEVSSDAKARTDSRISLVTGVHRKEIRRLREQEADTQSTPEIVTVASEIIARWLGADAYRTADGRPRPLARTGGSDSAPSFETLVGSVTTDIRARAVLDDWLSQGMVVLDGSDRVQLNTAAFIPRVGGEAQLFYFGRNLHDHVAAAVANICAAGVAPFLDRSLHYDRLSPEASRALEEFAREAGMKALLDANRLAIQLVEQEPKATAATPINDRSNDRRVNFGIYIYTDKDTPTPGSGS